MRGKNKLIFMFLISFLMLSAVILSVSLSYNGIELINTFLIIKIMENAEYFDKKQNLKDKYTEEFLKEIEQVGKNFNVEILNVLGNAYTELKCEYLTLEKSNEQVKKEFFASTEYISAKNDVETLKNELETLNGEEFEEKNKLLHSKLSSLATLNTTLNNRLKATRERLDELRKSIYDLFEIHKEALNVVKDETIKTVSGIIAKSVVDFNVELNKIKKDMGIVDNKKEYPFDFDKIELTAFTDKFQSNFFTGVGNGNEDIEDLDNDNSVQSTNLFDFRN